MGDSLDAFFVAEHDYSSADANQLTFKAGQIIKIHEYTDDWWLGSLASGSAAPGWFSPSFGHVSAAYSTIYNDISNDERTIKKTNAFLKIISDEKVFISILKQFLDTIIVPLSKRDTQFKRMILSQPSIGLTFNLVTDIYTASTNFLSALETATNAGAIADIITQYAPSLDMFATLTVEYPNFINDIKVHLRALETYAKDDNHAADTEYIVSAVKAPLDHYEGYLTNVTEYTHAHVTLQNTGDQPAVAKAFEAIKNGVTKINQRMKEKSQRDSLLILQTQFQGNAVIYTPTRLLRVNGKVEKVQKKDGKFKSKEYYMHLFNDSLIYSIYNKMSGTFKIHKSIDLIGTVIQLFRDEEAIKHFNGYTNVFVIYKANDDKKSDVFRCATPEKAKVWYSYIKDVIFTLNYTSTKLATKRSSITHINISGVTLGSRMTLVKEYLSQEITVAQALKLMQSSFAKSMSDCCRGAPLVVTMPDEILSESPDVKYNTETPTKAQKEAMTELLLDADVQVFLRALDTLSSTLQDFIKTLQENCEGKKWTENVCIGEYFTSVTAKTLLSNYKSYATGQQATNRILKKAIFRSFYKDSDMALSMFPGTLSDKIEGIRNRPKVCMAFLQNLLAVTPLDHPDNKGLVKAIEIIQPLFKAVEETINSKINFEKLLSIQASIVGTAGVGFFSSKDPIVERLASTDRTFVKEGDLKKVCRKVNKTFRFWLFNDCLMYGKLQGNNTYIFHRNIFLKDCTVRAHSGDDMLNAFEILGAEKSFIVLCNSKQQQQEWLKKLLELTPKEGESKANTQAPIWKPDAPSQTCCVCKNKFGLFRRAHHCRMCGLHCCDEHSKSREIIEHISASEKQRLCDNCSKINVTFEAPKTTAKSAVTLVATNPKTVAVAVEVAAPSINPFSDETSSDVVPPPPAVVTSNPFEHATAETLKTVKESNPFDEISEKGKESFRRKSPVQEMSEAVERVSLINDNNNNNNNNNISPPSPSRISSVRRGAPPPPPVDQRRPPPPPPMEIEDDIEVEAPNQPENPMLQEFRQKLKFKIPPIAVKQMMGAKGFSDPEIQVFFEGEGIFDKSLFTAPATPALRRPPPPPPCGEQPASAATSAFSTAPPKPSFLGDINANLGVGGLKKVTPPEEPKLVVENRPAAGSMMAEMMTKKLKHVEVEAASKSKPVVGLNVKKGTDFDLFFANHPNHPESDDSDNDGSEHDSDSDDFDE